MELDGVTFQFSGAGLGTLDRLHRRVIELLALLSECAEAEFTEVDQRSNEFLRLLGELSATFQEQFRCESALHQAVVYPLVELHSHKHDGLIHRIARIRSDLADRPTVDFPAIAKSLVNGLDEHTFFWDAAFRDYLREVRSMSDIAFDLAPAANECLVTTPFNFFSRQNHRSALASAS